MRSKSYQIKETGGDLKQGCRGTEVLEMQAVEVVVVEQLGSQSNAVQQRI